MSVQLGTGWLPDPPKAKGAKPDHLASELLGTSPILDAATSRRHILGLLNQDRANSCVANAGFQAIRADQHRQGVSHPKLGSRWWGYWLARAQHGAQHEDLGTYLRAFFFAMNKFGFPPEEAWPYLFDEVEGGPRWSAMPSSDVFRLAFDQRRPLAYKRITEVGYDRVDAVKRAIMQERVVCWGARLDDRWYDFRGGYALDVAIPSRIVGGHAMVAAEYVGDEILGPNTWGGNWGEHGWYRCTADLVAHPSSGDFWIVESAPLFTEAVAG